MARDIVLEEREWINIKNPEGEITGGFYFNPTDFGIADRCDEVIKWFDELKIPEEFGNDERKELEKGIKDQFDYLLGGEASAQLFKFASPISMRVDGTLFAEYVLSVMTAFIEKEFTERTKKANKRIEKYTEKYGR